MVLALIQPHVRLLTGEEGLSISDFESYSPDLSRHSGILEKNPLNFKTDIPPRNRHAPRERKDRNGSPSWATCPGYTPQICPKDPVSGWVQTCYSAVAWLCKATPLVWSYLDILSHALTKGWRLDEGINNDSISYLLLIISVYARDYSIYFICTTYLIFTTSLQGRYYLHVTDEEIKVSEVYVTFPRSLW